MRLASSPIAPSALSAPHPTTPPPTHPPTAFGGGRRFAPLLRCIVEGTTPRHLTAVGRGGGDLRPKRTLGLQFSCVLLKSAPKRRLFVQRSPKVTPGIKAVQSDAQRYPKVTPGSTLMFKGIPKWWLFAQRCPKVPPGSQSSPKLCSKVSQSEPWKCYFLAFRSKVS